MQVLPDQQETTSVPGILSWLGSHRDGFLVAGAVLYGLGYLVWSYNAWKNGLGQLPALEFQYLIAGIIPAVLLVLAWSGVAFFAKFRKKILTTFERHPRLQWVILGVIGAFFIVLTLVQMGVQQEWLSLGVPASKVAMYLGPLFLVGSYLQIAAQGGTEKSRVMSFIVSVYRYVLGVLFFGYAMVAFLDLYPHLPQELGGPAPRCAYIDLDSQGLSAATLEVLVPATQPRNMRDSDQASVVRSSPLQVFFSSSDYLLVRPVGDASGKDSSAREEPLYELRREAIRVVRWCN